jgi:hypothetical protein
VVGVTVEVAGVVAAVVAEVATAAVATATEPRPAKRYLK